MIKPTTLLIIVVVFMLFKYWYDLPKPVEIEPQSVFSRLEQTMAQRLVGIPESVKRRINLSEQHYSYFPHRASYRVLMHVGELFSGNAIAQVSSDCNNWYEDFAVKLMPSQRNSATLFDYKAQRMESLTGFRAEVSSRTLTLVNGDEEVTEENRRFQRINDSLEIRSEGESYFLNPDTKLNIEGAHYILSQIEQQNWQVEYLSEPGDFSQYPIQNKVQIEAFKQDHLLDNLWIIKTREYKDDGDGYQLHTTVLELINDRAVTLYAATIDRDGVLYELIMSDFEYLTSRCRQVAML
jgi:hypothetical protein